MPLNGFEVDIFYYEFEPEADEHYEFETMEAMFKELPMLQRLKWLVEDDDFVSVEYQIDTTAVAVRRLP